MAVNTKETLCNHHGRTWRQR